MDHDRPTHRSYNEKEIGALIQRATALHEEATGASEHTRSLSIEEVEHIASEIGLPPEHVRTAALEMEDRLYTDRSFSIWGGPFVIDQARVVDGTMTEEQWEQILLEIRRFMGRRGRVSEVGRAREWRHTLGEGDDGFNLTKTEVTIRPADGQTSIQIRKHYGGTAVPAYLGAFFLSILFTILTIEAFDGMGLPDLVNWALLGGIGFGALAVVRGSISLWARRQKERLKRLTDLLQQTLSASSSHVLANEPTPGLIEIPEMDEPEGVPVEPRRGIRI